MLKFTIQSTLFKTDTFGTSTKILSKNDVRLWKSQIKETKNSKD